MRKEAGPLRVGTNFGTRGTNKNSDLGVPDPVFFCPYAHMYIQVLPRSRTCHVASLVTDGKKHTLLGRSCRGRGLGTQPDL